MQDTFYSVLGLDPRASPDQVEKAYRFSIKLYQEDSLAITSVLEPTEAALQRHRVREAYEVLSDPEKRRAYDEGLGFLPPDSPDLPSPEPDCPLFPPDRGITVTFSDDASIAAEIAEPRLAALLSPDSRAFESFRVLRTKVRALGAERPLGCLGLVSAIAQEGTSAVAVGLAGALAQEPEQRVLLVEATLRKPALEQALGLTPEPGLSEWLGGPASGAVPLRRGEPRGLPLLAGGAPPPPPSGLLSPASLGPLLAPPPSRLDPR